MKDVKFLNFADLFLNPQYTELDDLIAELKEAGITAEANQDKIFNLLRQKKSELTLQTQRRLKEEYLKLKTASIVKESIAEFAEVDTGISYYNKVAAQDDTTDSDAVKRRAAGKVKN